ncbi:hypothetical protein JVX96_03355 [Variovorax sp. PDNC026]|uniref:hypothetical protein n=1 Tax=Variovorax sp. PDNC026 TaxID=2811425 RepID=UPI00196337E4|nr:hypothetical protein [Variovorax sp. PDNC026]QRY32359.1 hypothetical protein JVX96_03355 [Variovorax sp. PDNC026]
MCDTNTDPSLAAILGTPEERGQWYSDTVERQGKFKHSISTFLAAEKSAGRYKNKSIVLSDVMSGDARLVALYASAVVSPLIYIRTKSRAGSPDVLCQYFKELGVSVYTIVMDDSQAFYNAFNPQGIPILKGAKLTERIAEVLKTDRAPRFPSELTKSVLLAHASDKLAHEDVDYKLLGPCIDDNPIALLWTKSSVAGGLYHGHPEHLIGKAGLRQICTVLKECGFKVAVAGDRVDLGDLSFDFDLRFVADGVLKGLSLTQQYGALKLINGFSPLLSISMRSGQVEPLPLLDIKTIYMEELGNMQGNRMQKLQDAMPGVYSRVTYALPPTFKGRLRELATFFYSHPFRSAVAKHDKLSTDLQRLIVALLRAADPTVPSTYTYEALTKDTPRIKTLDAIFKQIEADPLAYKKQKAELVAHAGKENFPRGFYPESIAELRLKLATEYLSMKKLYESDKVKGKKIQLALDFVFPKEEWSLA